MDDMLLFTDVDHRCVGKDWCRVCAENAAAVGMQAALEAKPLWRERADLWFKMLDLGVTFTSEDLVDAVGFPNGEQGTNQNNAVGAYMRALSSRGLVQKVDIRSSQRVSSHGAALVVWKKI